MGEDKLPLPPSHLAKRVGGTEGEAFEKQGLEIKKFIIVSLPEDYDFTNKRVLDFGCGCGRVLRHFQVEARMGEFWACDIHLSTTTWLSENMPTHFRIFHICESPHLPIESNFFDLIYVVSVFTHLTTMWKPWLLELRRALKTGGTALITFHNRIAYEYNTGKYFDEQNAGMLVTHEDREWDNGGPMVYHSNWWIQKHWGQFFDIEYISREGLFNWQSLAVLTKPEGKVRNNTTCPVLQPYPYGFYDPNFMGDLHIPGRRSNYLRYWHGLEMKVSENGEGNFSGWAASKAGKITRIRFIVDDKEVLELPGTNRERKDVEMVYPDWPYSLYSGFEATVNLSDFEVGEHQLKVIATDSRGNRREGEIPLILLPN
jgi:SAM-dependent methyltransferase